ncbi:MAG: lipopolysaccharide biosynthesis protein [Acidimicrobiia bacterium]
MSEASTQAPASHELRRRALGAVIWSFVQSWGGRAITAALFLVLGRLLGPSTLGLAAYATLFVEFGRVLIDQGFSQTIVQRPELDDTDIDTAFWTATALGAALTVVSFLAAPWVADAFARPAMEPLLRWLSLNFVLAGLGSTHLGLLQRELRFKALAIQRLVGAAAGGVVGLAMAFAHRGVWSMIGLQLTTTAVGTALVLLSAARLPHARFSGTSLAALRAFAVSVMGLQLLDFLHANGDNFIIGLVLGDRILGYYVLAYRVYTVTLEVLGTAVSGVAFPVFSRVAGDRERLRRIYLEAVRITATVAFPVFIGLAVVANDASRVAFGSRFDPAGPMLRVLALIALTNIAGWFQRSLLLAVGRAGLAVRASAVFVIVKLGVFAALVSHGVAVALVAQLFTGLLLFPVDRAMLHAGGVRYRDHVRQLVEPIAACAVMSAAVMLWLHTMSSSWGAGVRLMTAALLGAVTYVVVLAAVAPSNIGDIVRNVRAIRGGSVEAPVSA